MPRTKAKPPGKPHDFRLVVVQGVEYYVYWEKLTLGASFFLPTTGTIAQVKRAIRDAVRHHGYVVELRTRREYGRYGVRVWRMN